MLFFRPWISCCKRKLGALSRFYGVVRYTGGAALRRQRRRSPPCGRRGGGAAAAPRGPNRRFLRKGPFSRFPGSFRPAGTWVPAKKQKISFPRNQSDAFGVLRI
nr:MAG TPA: hypothetical protein [Caudoviricetes sp.]